MKNIFNIIFLLLLVSGSGCQDQPANEREFSDETPLFINLQVTGEEDKETITCMVQVRLHNPDGPAILLDEPACLEIDGELLVADSAGFSGFYYERDFPAADFGGSHNLRFKSPAGKVYEAAFQFHPFKMGTQVAGGGSSGAILLKLEDFPAGEKDLVVSIVDTEFSTDDFHERVTFNNGEAVIGAEKLAGLEKGPAILELSLEESTQSRFDFHRARIQTRYSLSREIELN